MNAASYKTVDCLQCEALMPGYINGELSGELSRAMQEHNARCPACAQLQSEAHQIKDSLQKSPESLDDLLRASTRNKNLQNVLARIDQASSVAEKPATTVIDQLRGYWQTMPWSLKGAFYAQSVALLVFAGLYFNGGDSAPLSEYQTYTDAQASNATASASSSAGVPYQVFRVIFHPKANEENVRQLLLDIDAQITGGPSLSGVYTLATGVNTGESQSLHSLRSSPWVELAEPVIYFNVAEPRGEGE